MKSALRPPGMAVRRLREHRHGLSIGGKRARVGGGIDPRCHAAHHGHPRAASPRPSDRATSSAVGRRPPGPTIATGSAPTIARRCSGALATWSTAGGLARSVSRLGSPGRSGRWPLRPPGPSARVSDRCRAARARCARSRAARHQPPRSAPDRRAQALPNPPASGLEVTGKARSSQERARHGSQAVGSPRPAPFPSRSAPAHATAQPPPRFAGVTPAPSTRLSSRPVAVLQVGDRSRNPNHPVAPARAQHPKRVSLGQAPAPRRRRA